MPTLEELTDDLKQVTKELARINQRIRVHHWDKDRQTSLRAEREVLVARQIDIETTRRALGGGVQRNKTQSALLEIAAFMEDLVSDHVLAKHDEDDAQALLQALQAAWPQWTCYLPENKGKRGGAGGE